MKATSARIVLSSWAVVGAPVAQTLVTASPKEVVPSWLTSSTDTFFGMPLAQRSTTMQQVHGASSFTNSGPATFNEMRFGNYVINQNMQFSIDIEFFVAAAPHAAAGAQPQIAANLVPATEVNVFRRKSLSLQGYSNPEFRIVFDTPFAWSGSHLSWRSNCYTPPTPADWHFKIGAAGVYSTGKQVAGSCDGGSHGRVGIPGDTAWLSATVADLQRDVLGALVLGSVVAWVPLASYGAPTCWMIWNPVVVGSGKTDSEGSVFFSFPVPNQPALAGVEFAHQAAFLRPGKNALGVTTSSLCRDRVQWLYDVATISDPNRAGATQGTLVMHTAAYVAFY